MDVPAVSSKEESTKDKTTAATTPIPVIFIAVLLTLIIRTIVPARPKTRIAAMQSPFPEPSPPGRQRSTAPLRPLAARRSSGSPRASAKARHHRPEDYDAGGSAGLYRKTHV